MINLFDTERALSRAIEGSNMIFHSLTFARSHWGSVENRGEARGFQPSRGTLRMLMNDKIMFVRYYCMNSAKIAKTRKHWRTIFYNLITFSYASTLLKTKHDSSPVQILIILHVLCMVHGNKHN